MIELVDRDASGRICKFNIKEKQILTPNIAIVVNPRKQIIAPKDMKKYGVDLIITNSFIINRNEKLRKESNKGLHKMLKWKGPIYTDSGTFQMYSQNIKDIDPKKIINFQKKIGSDIITPVDMFTLPDDSKTVANKKLIETTKRIKYARSKVDFLNAPIQGGMFLDLRKKACKQAAKIEPDVFSIGGIVPLMEQYRFKELCNIIITCKENLPTNIPVHAFGAGHPMIFSLLASIGCDLFDSAMYSLAAQRDAYLTNFGTYHLNDLQEFPCHCPVCLENTPQEIKGLDKNKREEFLTKHNLYVTMSEIRSVRQAIRDDSLWELVQQRVRAHPHLLVALKHILEKHKKYLLSNEKLTKKTALKYQGEETSMRPEVIRSNEWKKRVKSRKYYEDSIFNKVPLGLKGLYPFGQSVSDKGKLVQVSKPEILKATLEYQFKEAFDVKGLHIETSRKTGRLRRVMKKGKLLGTFRSHDGLFLPSKEGFKILKPKKITVKDKEAVEFIKNGKSVFAKFVYKSDDIVPGEEVVVVNGNEIIAGGRAIMNRKEIKEFERGSVIKRRF